MDRFIFACAPVYLLHGGMPLHLPAEVAERYVPWISFDKDTLSSERGVGFFL